MKALRRLAWALALLVLLVTFGVLLPRPFGAAPLASRQHRILVLSNPIHTDIAIPLDANVRRDFAFLLRDGLPLDAPGAAYLTFGWGGRAFYIETPTWSELKPMPLLKGITADRSTMHVSLAGDIATDAEYVAVFDVDEAGYRALTAYIRASFTSGAAGEPILIPGAAYSDYDRFYEAEGTFTALLGCNTWTARGLRIAGLRTGAWTPLPSLLRLSTQLHN